MFQELPYWAAILWLTAGPWNKAPSLAPPAVAHRSAQVAQLNALQAATAAHDMRAGGNAQNEEAVDTGQLSGAAAAPRAGSRPRLLSDPFETPQQLLGLLDVSQSDLDSFVDGEPIRAADEEAFLKILFRMPQIAADDIARWAQSPVPWPTLAAEPSACRGEFFQLQGRVRSVTRQTVRPQLAALFDMEVYYEVGIEVTGGFAVTVCARNIPQTWHGRTALDERCRVSAMFLKQAAADDQQRLFLFAAPRIAWLPDHINRELGIGPDQVLLGNLDMDVGLLDAVRTRNGLPISTAERECFYAMLRAVSRATAAEIAQHAAPLRLAPLLQQPEQLQGDVLRVYGSVQRITRVAVNERDIQQRFGIDHYYQLDVLVPLDGAAVQVKGQQPDEPGPVYRSNFPFTCCTLSIPPAWQPRVGQERASELAVLDGFFFKLWSYSNPYVASFDTRQRQLSPMLILREPACGPSADEKNHAVSIAIGAGFLLALTAIWVALWRLNRADRQHTRALQQRLKPDQQPDFLHVRSGDE